MDMDIKEKAQKYVQDRGQQVFNDAIAAAYTAGYQQGYKDCKAANPSVCDEIEEEEYIDLGLPSGTLWAKDYAKKGKEYIYSTYLDAEHENLPTKEQFLELRDWCKKYYFENSDTKTKSYKLLGPSGKRIFFKNIGFCKDMGIEIYDFFQFWLLEDGNTNLRKTAFYNSEGTIMPSNTFMGYKLPLRLVKSKK